MSLMRWDPFRELEDMSTRLNRLFSQPLARRTADDGDSLSADWAPAVDVQETDKEYLVKADLPEVKKEDVAVDIQDGMLSVRGERHQEKEEKGKKFHRIERAYGRFERRLALPSEVDAQKVAAEFKDGVLKVHLPKSATAQPKTINVNVS
ncbi:MAG: heat-shock protein Hsp20 [Acidobacteria bacterium RIFCSPLOWO2_02_FULL_65_29]|nr:MAG: heat-shock protein Hsp20 [Acidobacteria bacterium RIFCSPLOWO2_02_FULL_65_29]